MKMIVKQRFLVSFMVDARGGAMRGCRHSGVRVIIPPRKAAMPTRITCRYLKKDKLVHAPPLMEGEALASRILEMGPAGAKFLGPVILEVPHFASLRGKEREIVILRSDNGETWREHTLEATEEAVQEVLNESFDGEELKQLEDLNTSRITRILTTDFPQYFAIVTRIRQEVHAIGPDGGMVSSTVVPQVQAVFPQGALTKKIKVGLQAQPISPDLAAKLLGNRVAVSPIVTVEPRRRKFHKPITLTLPVPQAASKGMINQYSGDAPTLRLLCSITGGTTRAQWEDVTGSTPLTFVNDCVSFTTTVSARFWLMDCTNIPEATRMATELYREAIHVPFMSKFAVFAKRHQQEEARMRVFCMTDDREDKTLETQEQFREVAKSRDVEVLEGKTQYLEFAGNIVPVTKSGDQLSFNFYAFRENRLPFTVRFKDQHTESVGRVAFMRQPKVGRGDAPQNPICNLNIALPETIQPEPAPSEPDLLALEKKYTFLSISKADTIHKADLRFSDISNMLDCDWVDLAREIDISDSDINIIKSEYPDNAPQQALVMLRLWMQAAGNKATGNTLEKGLRKINRVDIVNQCMFNLEPVTDDKERAVAKAQIDTSVIADSPHVSRKDGALNRDASMDVSYDEHDMMKDAESADEEDDNQKTYQGKRSATDLSPTYESEEKKYAAEEKVIAEEISKPLMKSATITQGDVDEFLKDTESAFDEKLKKIVSEERQEIVPEKYKDKPVVEETFSKSIVEKSKEEPDMDHDVPEKKDLVKTTTAVKTETFEDGSHSIITTKTTERRSFIVDDDGDSDGVREKIVVEKRTDSADASPADPNAKNSMLQMLGEELGKLDDRLEERFKEKRKVDHSDEDEFTQTSALKMSGDAGSAPAAPAEVTPTPATTEIVKDSTTIHETTKAAPAAAVSPPASSDAARLPEKKDAEPDFILANPYARIDDDVTPLEANVVACEDRRQEEIRLQSTTDEFHESDYDSVRGEETPEQEQLSDHGKSVEQQSYDEQEQSGDEEKQQSIEEQIRVVVEQEMNVEEQSEEEEQVVEKQEMFVEEQSEDEQVVEKQEMYVEEQSEEEQVVEAQDEDERQVANLVEMEYSYEPVDIEEVTENLPQEDNDRCLSPSRQSSDNDDIDRELLDHVNDSTEDINRELLDHVNDSTEDINRELLDRELLDLVTDSNEDLVHLSNEEDNRISPAQLNEEPIVVSDVEDDFVLVNELAEHHQDSDEKEQDPIELDQQSSDAEITEDAEGSKSGNLEESSDVEEDERFETVNHSDTDNDNVEEHQIDYHHQRLLNDDDLSENIKSAQQKSTTNDTVASSSVVQVADDLNSSKSPMDDDQLSNNSCSASSTDGGEELLSNSQQNIVEDTNSSPKSDVTGSSKTENVALDVNGAAASDNYKTY